MRVRPACFATNSHFPFIPPTELIPLDIPVSFQTMDFSYCRAVSLTAILNTTVTTHLPALPSNLFAIWVSLFSLQASSQNLCSHQFPSAISFMREAIPYLARVSLQSLPVTVSCSSIFAKYTAFTPHFSSLAPQSPIPNQLQSSCPHYIWMDHSGLRVRENRYNHHERRSLF